MDRDCIDGFIGLENGTSPFGVKECATKYNASTGKQEIMTYKGESDWDSAIADTEHEVMIEFPKFYYKRPSETEWYVSKTPFPGSSPSPMHYRNGVMYDKWYISKYLLKSDLRSQSGKGAYAAHYATYTQYPSYRDKLKSKGMYMFDYASYCAIVMLVLIKHAISDTFITYGYGASNLTTTGSMDDYGLEATMRNASDFNTGNNRNANFVIFGLENLFADNSTGVFVDGVFVYSNSMYINTDIENLPSENPSVDSNTGYILVNGRYTSALASTLYPQYCYLDLSPNFPFAMKTVYSQTNTTNYKFGEFFNSNGYPHYIFDTNGYNVLNIGYYGLLGHTFGNSNNSYFRSQCHL